MANLWAEGLGGLAVGASQVGLRFDNVQNAQIITATNPVPPNGQSLRNQGGAAGAGAFKNVTTHTTGFCGLRVLVVDVGQVMTVTNPLVSFHNAAGARQFYIAMNTAGRITAHNNAGTILGTSTGFYSLVEWFYLEVSYTISATVGAIEVRTTRGITVATEMTLTGLNNANGTANCGQVGVAWLTNGSERSASADFYLNDSDGASPDNGYWGDTRYVYAVPSGAGANAAFTPNTGTNWQSQDELPGHTTDTDYVESSVVTTRDMYAMTDLASTATTFRNIKAIITARAPNGAASLSVNVRSGGTTNVGTSQGLSTGAYTEIVRNFGITNPVTAAAFTLAELQAVEIGFEVS